MFGPKTINLFILLLSIVTVFSFLIKNSKHCRRFHIKYRLYKLKNSLVSNVINLKEKVDKGCVLVAKANEYDHFLIKSIIFIIENGERGSQGVIINKV